MKKFMTLSLLVLSTCSLFAQINAITETGDEVILYNDGTWSYLNDSVRESKEIEFNDKKFTKNKNSTFLIKSKQLNVGIWIDSKKWKFGKAIDNEDAEYEFERKGEDLYGMLISEKMEIPLETLGEIALENARDVSPDTRKIKEEYRIVNGIKVLMMQMSGTILGMRITYYSYYYSNENGTIQFITYTSQSLIDDYLNDIEELLNGLVEL
jgi:hypothetical protein